MSEYQWELEIEQEEGTPTPPHVKSETKNEVPSQLDLEEHRDKIGRSKANSITQFDDTRISIDFEDLSRTRSNTEDILGRHRKQSVNELMNSPGKKTSRFKRLSGLLKKTFASDPALDLSGIRPGTPKPPLPRWPSDHSIFGLPEEFTESTDNWTYKGNEYSTSYCSQKWKELQSGEMDQRLQNMVDLKYKEAGYNLEMGSTNLDESFLLESGAVCIEETEKDVTYYKTHFYKKDHLNIISTGENTTLGPVCISVEGSTLAFGRNRRAILRSKMGTERFIMNANCNSTKEMVKFIKGQYPDMKDMRFCEVNSDELQNRLLDLEKKSIVTTYKFGVLYVKDGQTDDNEMFSNNEMSEDFKEFLDFLGERVELKGWKSFRGGLDIKNDSTGTHSVYTKYGDGFEIMFHVSTLLPFQPEDLQRVERKRHLGNDVVVVIFKEGDTPFDPSCIKSQFNHVFVIISVHQGKSQNGKTRYKMCIVNKRGVRPYAPFIPQHPVFEKNELFRGFLLTKLINAERAAMYAPDFKGKLQRTNQHVLSDLISTALEGRKSKKTRGSSFESALKEVITNQPKKKAPMKPKRLVEEFDANVAFDGEESTPHKPLPLSECVMSRKERDQLADIFFSNDADKDGLITGMEAARVFVESELANEILTKIWSLSDMNCDLHLNFEEFVIASFLVKTTQKGYEVPDHIPEELLHMAKGPWHLSAQNRTEFQKEFERTDEDKDGVISGREAAMLFIHSGLKTSELAKIWALADLNKDRKLHFEEYILAQLLVRHRLQGEQLLPALPTELMILSCRLKAEQESKDPNEFSNLLKEPVEDEEILIKIENIEEDDENTAETEPIIRAQQYRQSPTKVGTLKLITLTSKKETQGQLKNLLCLILKEEQDKEQIKLNIYGDEEDSCTFILNCQFPAESVFEEWKDNKMKNTPLQSYLAKEPEVTRLRKLVAV